MIVCCGNTNGNFNYDNCDYPDGNVTVYELSNYNDNNFNYRKQPNPLKPLIEDNHIIKNMNKKR